MKLSNHHWKKPAIAMGICSLVLIVPGCKQEEPTERSTADRSISHAIPNLGSTSKDRENPDSADNNDQTETSTATARPNCKDHQKAVASVETVGAAATICQWQGDGKLEYHGTTKSSGDEITVPVTKVVEQANHPGLYSYTAINSGYTYRVDDQTALAIIAPDGTMVFYERQP
ncbi:hypothetical protein WKY82_00295 [Gordonia malaquae]|uniref:hypothetical protein n=1 Tax=Gordonia malaquae TaxID=410332 RepID=UPI0030C78960